LEEDEKDEKESCENADKMMDFSLADMK